MDKAVPASGAGSEMLRSFWLPNSSSSPPLCKPTERRATPAPAREWDSKGAGEAEDGEARRRSSAGRSHPNSTLTGTGSAIHQERPARSSADGQVRRSLTSLRVFPSPALQLALPGGIPSIYFSRAGEPSSMHEALRSAMLIVLGVASHAGCGGRVQELHAAGAARSESLCGGGRPELASSVSPHSASDVVCCQSWRSHGKSAGRGPQLFLRGGGRSWIKRSIKAASKKERQRKKRNIDSTNLRASVKLDPKAVPPGLLLQNELETQALAWIMSGCRPEALPTVNPLDAIEEAKLRLQSMPDVPPRVPRTLKSRQDDEDAEMNDGGEDGGEQQSEDVGSKGSRAIRPARSERGKVAAALQKKASRQGAGGKQGSLRASRKGMRLRGGAQSMSDDDTSSAVSDDTSSVVSSSSSSSFVLGGHQAPRPSAEAAEERQRPGQQQPAPLAPPAPPAPPARSAALAMDDVSRQIHRLDLDQPSQAGQRPSSTSSSKRGIEQTKPAARASATVGAGEGLEEKQDDDGVIWQGGESSEVTGTDEDTSGGSGSGSSGTSSEDTSNDEGSEMETMSSSADEKSLLHRSMGSGADEAPAAVATQHRLVTQLRTNPAAFGLTFDVEVVGKSTVEITAFATASHITCPHPMDIQIAVGSSRGPEDIAAGDPADWHTVLSLLNSSALPQLWECEPESPTGYGVLPLQESIRLAPGDRRCISIRTSHPYGLVLRALQPATPDKPETQPGTGKARLSYGDVADKDDNLALWTGLTDAVRLRLRVYVCPGERSEVSCAYASTNRTLWCAGRVVQQPLGQSMDWDDESKEMLAAEAKDAYAFAGMVTYSTCG